MPAEDLQIEHDLGFQRREWVFQRIGAWAVLAFVLAAALGFFGAGGAFSRGRAEAPEMGLSVEYERFVRRGAPARLRIHCPVAKEPAATREIELSRSYFDSIRIEQIVPEPEQIVVGPERVTLEFAAAALPQRGSVTVDYQPLEAGGHPIEVRVDETARVSFTQFAYF